MSVRKNTTANYLGQAYSIGIGIIVLPLYLRYLGAEAYGLVGLFTLIQSWMSLLDMGMSPTLGREVARLKGNAAEQARLKTVVNSLELIFVTIAITIAISLVCSSQWIATSWLKVNTLPLETVTQAIVLIAIVVAIRWVASLHKSAINAYEAQVWMNVFEVTINTLRFPLILLVIANHPGEIMIFFWCQLAVSLIEFAGVKWKSHSLLPQGVKGRRFSPTEIKRILPFALGIGYTGAIWVFLTQYDKLLLSNVLTLENYGYFALMATVTSGIMMLSGPISKAILPRMTALLAEGKLVEMIALYRKGTRGVVMSVTPIVLIIVCWPYEIIFAWSGSREAALWSADILPIFVAGSYLVTIIGFQHALQYAYGQLKYNVYYNTFVFFISLPLITYAAYQYGVIGVAWVWLGFRVFSFIVWLPFVHLKFAPGLHKVWLVNDVAKPLLTPLSLVVVAKVFAGHYLDLHLYARGKIFVFLIIIAFVISLIQAAFYLYGRNKSRESYA